MCLCVYVYVCVLGGGEESVRTCVLSLVYFLFSKMHITYVLTSFLLSHSHFLAKELPRIIANS